MAGNPFMDKLRSFLGLQAPSFDPPRNDFRNPIWGDDDDDDGDELYTRDHTEAFRDPLEFHEFTRQMSDMFKVFGSIFGDIQKFYQDFDDERIDSFTNTESAADPQFSDSNAIRDYYLKPGYHNRKYENPKEDIDLDGKISSQEISGLLKQQDQGIKVPDTPFNGQLVPGRSFCKTIITTRFTKPDGSIETKRIVKNGHDVVEETVTTTEPDPRAPSSALDSITSSGLIYSNVFSELGSLFKQFY